MAWIKFEKERLTDPRMLRMARRLCDAGMRYPFSKRDASVTPESYSERDLRYAVTVVVGAWVLLWIHADTHIGDDDTLQMGAIDVDRMLSIDGFCQLSPPEWLEVVDADSCVKLPGYQAHNGVEQRRRDQAAERMRRMRSRQRNSGDAVTPVDLDQDKTRPVEDPARAKALAPEKKSRNPEKRKAKAPTSSEGTAPSAVAAGLTAGGNGSGEAVPERGVELSVFGSDALPEVAGGELVLSGDPPAGNGEDKTPLQRACSATWLAYAAAYERRWGVAPVRSTIANAHILAFCKSVPQDEAPDIAAFFLLSNNAFYVSRKHDLSALRRDAAGLRTEWATGRQVTQAEARSGDKTAAVGNVFQKLIEEGRRFEEEERRRHASEA